MRRRLPFFPDRWFGRVAQPSNKPALVMICGAAYQRPSYIPTLRGFLEARTLLTTLLILGNTGDSFFQPTRADGEKFVLIAPTTEGEVQYRNPCSLGGSTSARVLAAALLCISALFSVFGHFLDRRQLSAVMAPRFCDQSRQPGCGFSPGRATIGPMVHYLFSVARGDWLPFLGPASRPQGAGLFARLLLLWGPELFSCSLL
jgi:hypothetical protein